MIDRKYVEIHGRYSFDKALNLYNTASGIEFNAFTKEVKISLSAISGQKDEAWVKVIIDNDYENALDLKIDTQIKEYNVYSSKFKQKHNFKVLKVSEAIESHLSIHGLVINGKFLAEPVYEHSFLVIGDSTVAGFGNLGHVGDDKTLYDTDGLQGFMYLTCKAFNASMCSLNGSGWGIGFSRWTTPQRRPLLDYYDKVAPISMVPWDSGSVNPDVALISIGTNDSSFIEIAETEEEKQTRTQEFKDNYAKLLEKIHDDYPNIPIFMIYGVMLEEPNYQRINDIYEANKDKYDLHLVKLSGNNDGVSYHPRVENHYKMADELINVLKEVIK